VNMDPNCVRALQALVPEIPGSDLNDIFLIRSRIADLNPSNLENLRDLALLGITYERFEVASPAIDKLEHTNTSPLAVLELRARLAAAQNDFADAGQQAQLLVQKDPANPVGRLIWLLAQLKLGNPANRQKAEGYLEDLLKVEPLKLEALRGLRQSALAHHEIARAKEFSESIVKNPFARFDDWLNHAEILFQEKPERLPELLQELTIHAQSDPQALASIAMWLRKNGQTDRIAAWADECLALRNNPVIAQMIRADTLVYQKAWPQLSSFLEPLNWGKVEFYRLALLARALREQNELFSKTWNAATTEAIKSSSSALQLDKMMASWEGWEEQREEFLWLMERRDLANLRWALSSLTTFYQSKKNTAGLLRVSEELYRAYPSNELVQNNLAFYSLLLNTRQERSERIIDALYVAHAQAPEIASTFSLAMIRKQDFKRALEVLEKLPPDLRSSPAIAPYYAIALAANGRVDEARKLKDGIDQSQLLPEEKQLLQF